MNRSSNRIEYREARTLRIHPVAQRDGIIKSKLKQITEHLDLDAIGTVHAVEYEINGEIAAWVIDGQHRIRALLDMGLGEWEVRVEFHDDCKDNAHASALFLELNFRAAVNPTETFRNELQARKPYAVAIQSIAKRYGFNVRAFSGDTSLACAAALKRVYAFDEGRSLESALATITSAWGHNAAANEAKLIEGLGLIFKSNNGSIDKADLVKKLAKFPGGPSALVGAAKGLREYKRVALPSALAEVVIDNYNKGRTQNLLSLASRNS